MGPHDLVAGIAITAMALLAAIVAEAIIGEGRGDG